MKIKTIALGAAVAALGALSGACQEPPRSGPQNTNAAAPANSNDTVKVQPKVVRDEAGPDNSHITVRQLENGDEIAVRKWDAGPIRKVTRRQKAGAATAIRVVYGNGRIVRVEDKNAIDHALDWTAAQIDEITKKVGKVVDEPPAATRQRGDDDDEK
jgi:hypothetical protein